MIVRTRPFTPAFDQRVDRMFAELTRSMTSKPTPEVAANWDEGSLHLTVDLPGTPDEAISLDVADRILTIAVDHEGTAWQRSVKLGAQLDPSQVSARYVHGRLTVTVAPAPEPEKRKIAIDTAPVAAATPGVVETTEAAESSELSESAESNETDQA